MASPSTSVTFYATCNRHQAWPIPDSIIYHMAKQPSSAKVYEKMIKTCKYFFIKNSLLLVSCLSVKYVDNQWKTWLDGNLVCLRNATSKIWVTDKLYFDNNELTEQKKLKFIISKIYQCDVKILGIGQQTIPLNVLELYALKCKEIFLGKLAVINENDSAVALEELFHAFPNVESFHYNISDNNTNIITSKTVKEILKFTNFMNLDKFVLTNIPEAFDIDSFFAYTKQNKKTEFRVYFCDHLSEAYTSRLQAMVNELLAAENHDYKVPYIYFFGIDETSRRQLWELF